jgi:putative sigma-54 modulation protein
VRILIHPRTITADAELRARTTEALESTLAPVWARLRWVDAYLTDVNGPRGGPDKRCRVVAHVATGTVVVERIGRDPVVVTAEAAARCRRLILERLKRSRDQRRRVAA